MNRWKITVLEQPIQAWVQKLDEGWDVCVFGGCRTHVGAVTLAQPGAPEQTMERLGHKDSHISRSWALRLAKIWDAPVCVRCGIHYDNATSEQLREIVAACDQLLETVIQEGNNVDGAVNAEGQR